MAGTAGRPPGASNGASDRDGTPSRFGEGMLLGDRYRIGSMLGCGGFGEVYEAEDLKLERKVALKAFRSAAVASAGGEDFLEEARVIARLDHPGIVAVHDAGVEAGVPWVCMRLVKGESLRSILDRDGTLAVERCAGLLAQACRALHHAHRHGVVHRDVKPSNLLVGTDDDGAARLFIVDFGLAALSGAEVTQSLAIRGTPAYMAPEQITGRRIDGRADLFSLACVGYEALLGARPFHGERVDDLLFAVVHSPPGELGRLDAAAGPRLAAVLRRALSKSPDDRFPSGEAMAKAIEDAVAPDSGGRRLQALAVRLLGRARRGDWDEAHTIDVDGLRKSYARRRPVLVDVSLRVERGAICALLGRNGTGKTTLIRTVLGLRRADAGSLAVFGKDPWRDGARVRARVGYVPESYPASPDLRVRQILDLLRSAYPTWDAALAHRLLGEYGMPLETRLRNLSRGGLTQLSLVGALAHRPDLLVLDDPTLGLDAIILGSFFETVREFSRREGTTVLVSSHNLDEIEGLASHAAILKDGRLVLSSSIAEIHRRVSGVEVTFRDDPPDLGTLPDLRLISSRGRRLTAAVLGDPSPTLRKLRALHPESLNDRELSLREVFVALTR